MKVNHYLYLFGLAILTATLFSCATSQVAKKGADNIPPKGKQLYFSHQHTFQKEQTHLFNKDTKIPSSAGLVINTSLLGTLSTKIVGSYEIESLNTLFDQYPNFSPVFLLSIDRTQLMPLCTQKFDENIAKLSQFFKSLNRPVYLTIGVEVNNPLYQIEPEKYKAAYRCIVDKFANQNVQNVAYVWYVNGLNPSYQEKDVMEWYPGNEYVNWLGTSVYKFEKEHFIETPLFTAGNYDRLFEIAEQEDLPVMIVESSAVSLKKHVMLGGSATWDIWYQPFFEMLKKQPRIKAFSHLNHNVEDAFLKEKWLSLTKESTYILGDEDWYKKLK